MKIFKPYREYIDPNLDPIAKALKRQNARRKMEFGVHEHCPPFPYGISYAGSYFYLGSRSSDIAKSIHKDVLECLKILPKLNLP